MQLIKSTRFAFAVCCAGMMSLAIAVNLLPVFLTTLQGSLGGQAGLSNEQLGRIGAVTFSGLVVGLLFTGPLADRIGAKLFTLVGNAMIAAGLVLLDLAPTYTAVLVAVFAMGVGAGVLVMVLSPIVAAVQPHRRSAAMNWLHSFYCTGAVATVLIGSLALQFSIPWRSISLGLAAMPLAVLLCFSVMHVPALVDETTGQRQHLRGLLRDKYFLAALIAIFLGGATELGMAQWLPAYAEKSLGYSKLTGGMALTAFSVAMALGRIGIGMLGNRVPAVRTMIVGCAASVVFFIVGCFAPWPAVALGACILAGLAGSSLWPSMLGVAADRFPRGGASMFGVLAAFGNLGGIAMPWIVGVAADGWGMHWGLATATLCPLFMGLILLSMRPRVIVSSHSLP